MSVELVRIVSEYYSVRTNYCELHAIGVDRDSNKS